MLDIFKNQHKRFFFLTDSFFSVIISVILHLIVVCFMLMQFTSEKKIEVNNFVVANLIDINEINKLINSKPDDNQNKPIADSKKIEVAKPIAKKVPQKTQDNIKSKPIVNAKKSEKIADKPKEADKIHSSDEPKKLADINSKKHIASNQTSAINEVDKKISYYSQLIQQEVAKNWKKPYAFNVSQATVVRIKLNYDGNIVDINLLSSSNNKLYDESILQAIKDASPLQSIKKMDIKTFTKNFTIIKLCFKPEDLD